MRDFTETLQTIMSVVSNQQEVLPASEGAVEEMTYVDEEEFGRGILQNIQRSRGYHNEFISPSPTPSLQPSAADNSP